MRDFNMTAPASSISITTTRQLALFIANEPGTLRAVCDALALAKINIYALSVSDTVDHAVVRMVVSDPDRALMVFEDHNAMVVESDVLMIESDNRPGTLAEIAQRLSKAKVNIEYAYLATSAKARRGLCILRPSDIGKATKALGVPAR